MLFLLFLGAVGAVVYGVITSGLAWVVAGAVVIGVLSSGRLGASVARDAKRLGHFAKREAKRAAGPPWRQVMLAALVCTAVAGWQTREDYYGIASLYFWLAGLVLAIAAGVIHDRSRAVEKVALQRWTRLDWGLAALLGLVALGLRLYQIGPFLPPMHGDEGEMGLLALLALHGPSSGLSMHRLPFFSTAFLDHPTLFHYLQAGSLWLFGESITSLRVVSALFGALCAPFLYAIGHMGWGRVAGFSAGWLLAVSHLHIHYSRIALNNIETVWLVIVLMWLLAWIYEMNKARPLAQVAVVDASATSPTTLEERSDVEGLVDAQPEQATITDPPRQQAILPLIALGLTMGLGQYFYYGSRLMPLLVGVLLIAMWLAKRVTVQQVAVAVAATVVAYFPLAFYYANDLRAFVNRLRGVSVFNAEGMAHTLGTQAVWPDDIPLLLWTQIKQNLYFFLHYGDRSSFYLPDIPAFDIITVTLFWLGLGMVVAKVRRYHELALLVWLGLGVFLAGVVTTDAPNGPRLIVAVPAMYVIAGLFLQRVSDFTLEVWRDKGQWMVMGTLGFVAASILYLNFNTYFVEYKIIQPNMAQVYLALEIADHAEEDRAYLMGTPNLFVNYGTLRFLAFHAETYDLETPEQFVEMVSEMGQGQDQASSKGAFIVALPQHLNRLAQIETQFPGGIRTERTTPRGNLYYVTYEIPAEELVKQLAK